MEQARSVLGHCGRVQALEQARNIFADVGGVVGASLQNSVNTVIAVETKRFHQRIGGDAAVAAELCASLEAEDVPEEDRCRVPGRDENGPRKETDAEGA